MLKSYLTEYLFIIKTLNNIKKKTNTEHNIPLRKNV